MMNTIICTIVCLAMFAGAFDKLRGNKWGLGTKFDEGLAAFAPLIVLMGGVLALTPAIAKFFTAYLVHICTWLHLDPAVCTGMLIANDCGAYHIAHSISSNPAAADFWGMLVGGVIGVHFIFTIPVAVGMTQADDHKYIIKGLFCGLAGALPGLLIGGLAAGNSLQFVLIQLIPVLIFITISGVMFAFCSRLAVRLCVLLGQVIGVVALVAVCLVFAAAVIDLGPVGKALPLMPLAEVISIVGMVTLTLPGAYVAAELFSRWTRKPLNKAGKCLKLDHVSITAMVISLANTLPVFGMTRQMSPLGKTVAYAFMAGSSFALGDHLAFCTATKAELTVPMLIAKLATAFFGALLAWFIFRRSTENTQNT